MPKSALRLAYVADLLEADVIELPASASFGKDAAVDLLRSLSDTPLGLVGRQAAELVRRELLQDSGLADAAGKNALMLDCVLGIPDVRALAAGSDTGVGAEYSWVSHTDGGDGGQLHEAEEADSADDEDEEDEEDEEDDEEDDDSDVDDDGESALCAVEYRLSQLDAKLSRLSSTVASVFLVGQVVGAVTTIGTLTVLFCMWRSLS